MVPLFWYSIHVSWLGGFWTVNAQQLCIYQGIHYAVLSPRVLEWFAFISEVFSEAIVAKNTGRCISVFDAAICGEVSALHKEL